jgi:hypothetical protein
MKYRNKRRFSTLEIEFLANGIKLTKKSVFEFLEYEVPFEQISNNKKVQSTISDGMLISAIILTIFGLLILFLSGSEGALLLIGIGIFLGTLTFLRRIRVITVHTFTGDDIMLYFNRANKDAVSDLADKIIAESISFLLRKYSRIDRALAIDPQIENLQFLRNRGILNEDEYEALKDQLLGRKGSTSIGYR